MIPPKPTNNNRVKKPLLRKKKADGYNTSFTNGKVSRKGITITCSLCGISRHNKKCHGVQEKDCYIFFKSTSMSLVCLLTYSDLNCSLIIGKQSKCNWKNNLSGSWNNKYKCCESHEDLYCLFNLYSNVYVNVW